MWAVPTLARRFLLAKSSDGFLSFIAWVSVVGVSLGVLALTVVTSVINGFEGELVRVITGVNGDVVLYTRTESVPDAAAITTKIKRVVPQAVGITSSLISELMTSGAGGVAGTVLEGIDPATVGDVTSVQKRVVSGRLPTEDNEVALASVLAERLGAKVGDEIRLIAPFTGFSDAQASSSVPKILKVRVVGIVRIGMYEYDSKFAFATLGAVQKFLEQPGRVSTFKIKLAPDVDSRKVSDRLNDNFGYPFRAKDWGQMNKNLFYAIRLEKVVIAIILTVIVIVAAFNVVSTLMMMIHDKTKEIAILKAMGFKRAQSFQLFCLIGMGIGTVGTSAGVLLGVGINWLLQKTHWIDLPADIYYIGFLPVVIRWAEIGVIAGAALLITFVATLYPAIGVSARSPLDGLRYE